MKFKNSIFSLLLWLSAASLAAQSCCCTSAGANYSILPNLDKNLVGLRYTYTGLDMVSKSLNPENDGLKTDEQLHKIEAFGRFNLNKQLQLSVFIPVNFIRQHSSVSSQQVTGLGDMSFLLQYALLNPLKCTGGESKHQIRIGLGSKLPTGDFRKNENNLYNTSMQPGSGSIDFLMNAVYTYRYRNFGFNVSGGYKLNTVNAHSFRFGDKADASVNVFYLFQLKEVKLAPSFTTSYSHLFTNFNHQQRVYHSDADLVTSTFAMDIYLPRIAFSVAFSPVAYNRVPFMSFIQRCSAEVGIFYNFQTTKHI